MSSPLSGPIVRSKFQLSPLITTGWLRGPCARRFPSAIELPGLRHRRSGFWWCINQRTCPAAAASHAIGWLRSLRAILHQPQLFERSRGLCGWWWRRVDVPSGLVSLKAEALYYDLGSFRTTGVLNNVTTATLGPVPAGTVFTATGVTVDSHIRGLVVRGCVNYHFAWGTTVPVVARY